MNPTRLREAVRHILRLDGPPQLLAKSFAVGVFVAFTPMLGFHTVTVLLLAWVFRLNKAVALSGTFVNNPWTMVFIFLGPTWLTVIGMRLLGIEVPPFSYESLAAHYALVAQTYDFWQPAFWRAMFHDLHPYLTALFVGTTAAGLVTAFAAYLITLAGIKFYRREKERLKRARQDG